MKPISHRSTVKSRGVVDRKSSLTTTVSRKRLRRLRAPIEDDEEDEDEDEEQEDDEVEEIELSPGTSSSIAPPRGGGRIPRKRGRKVVVVGDGDQNEDEEDGQHEEIEDDDILLIIDFSGGGGSSASSDSDLLTTISPRDFDHNPLHSDELDQLQSLMEKSLTDSILRKRNVRAALKQLAATTNSKSAGTPTTTRAIGKRKLPPHQTTTTSSSVLSKRPAVSSTTISSSSSPPAKRNRGAGGNKRSFRPADTTTSSISPIGRPCSRVYYYAQHNHQMPDKFWSFVDQYAGALQSDTLNLLEKLVADSDPNTQQSAQYYKMPEVVPHPATSTCSTSSRRPSSSMSSSDASRGGGHTNKSSGCSSPPPPNKSATAKAKAKTKTKVKVNKASANVVNNKKPAMKKRAGGVSNSSRSVDDDDHSAAEDDASSSSNTIRLSAQKKPLPPTTTTAKTRTPRKNAVKDPAKTPNTTEPSEKNGLSAASPLGPLTERLVQALLDDYVVTTTGNGGEDDQQTDSTKTGSNNKVLMKTLNLGNLKSLETRIKNELIDQGILEPEDHLLPAGDSSSSDADEVTAELKRSQRELAVLQRSNHQRLAALAARAKARHQWVGREAALREANEQVLHLCSRYYGTAPACRKPEGRAERDALSTALKEREKAAAKLASS